MTNLLAIALSVTIVARWYGFGGSDTPKQTALQAMLIVACFALLSVPLGLALKKIALQSQTELVVRTTLDPRRRRTPAGACRRCEWIPAAMAWRWKRWCWCRGTSPGWMRCCRRNSAPDSATRSACACRKC